MLGVVDDKRSLLRQPLIFDGKLVADSHRGVTREKLRHVAQVYDAWFSHVLLRSSLHLHLVANMYNKHQSEVFINLQDSRLELLFLSINQNRQAPLERVDQTLGGQGPVARSHLSEDGLVEDIMLCHPNGRLPMDARSRGGRLLRHDIIIDASGRQVFMLHPREGHIPIARAPVACLRGHCWPHRSSRALALHVLSWELHAGLVFELPCARASQGGWHHGCRRLFHG
mmetsp:Transcript_44718/g.103401  ORF Transcript_44718/g.103401 Transcript_44718/m.103401 type:complete len:227 (+) Transcript_44718:962-1642(+)